MGPQKPDKEFRKNLKEARQLIEEVAKADGNEAETRRRVERIFEILLGYDVFKHLTRELAVRGAGEAEYCDFAIQIDEGENAKPVIMIELKRVNIDLSTKHLKQISSYAINAGCEWILLTNGKEWKLYHVAFGQPPQTKLIDAWDLIEDNPVSLAKKFEIISYKNVKKGNLDKLWEKRNVLTTGNVLGTILSEDSIRLLRRNLNKSTDVNITPEEVVGAVRRLLNEAALTEMESMKISLPERKRRKRKDKLFVSKESEESPNMPPPITPAKDGESEIQADV